MKDTDLLRYQQYNKALELKRTYEQLRKWAKLVTDDPIKYALAHGWSGEWEWTPDFGDDNYELSMYVASTGCGGLGCWGDRMEMWYAILYMRELHIRCLNCGQSIDKYGQHIDNGDWQCGSK